MTERERDLAVSQLYDRDEKRRLEALAQLEKAMDEGLINFPEASADVNNHIHTIYSVSPYSPAAAVYRSKLAGLATCGLMDHDSIAGSGEFRAACRSLRMPGTQGCEIRCSFEDTAFNGRRLNNPDQETMAYVALHAIADRMVPAVTEFLKPIRERRLARNKKMLEGLNARLGSPELALDFDRDVRAISEYDHGGEITERHICFALAKKLMDQLGAGKALLTYLEERLRLRLSAKQKTLLTDPSNPYYAYDLLGVFKAEYVPQFFIPAAQECVPVRDLARFAKEHQICLAYAYLGDVGESVTGDKKAQRFEDAFLDELMPALKELGFNAITYMPSRNTKAQLRRLIGLCERYDFFQISGEDINQPRQAFICEALRDPEYAHLYDMAWALIGHERAVDAGESGLFGDEALRRWPSMTERVKRYRDLALGRR